MFKLGYVEPYVLPLGTEMFLYDTYQIYDTLPHDTDIYRERRPSSTVRKELVARRSRAFQLFPGGGRWPSREIYVWKVWIGCRIIVLSAIHKRFV